MKSCIFILALLISNRSKADPIHRNDGQPPKTIIGQQWRVVEISFISIKSYAQPFEDIELNANFTGPDGKTITRPAFWDGGNTWKIRFAPTAVGIWTMVTTCSDPANKKLQGVTQTIQCV